MKIVVVIVIAYLAGAFFFGWWPFELRTTGLLPLSQYENVDVNVYFYYPNDKEVHLGRVRGASSCSALALNYASTHNVSGSDWTYICCTVRHGSSCYEKIK